MRLGPFPPFRRWRFRAAPKAAILRYHRVADLTIDPYDFAVSPGNFAEHCAVLRDRFSPLPLGDIVAGLTGGRLPPRGVAVTFDDGYRDVLDTARPILERFQVPATAFVVTGMTGGRTFWWDTLERIFLWPGRLPERLSLSAGRVRIVASLGTAACYDAGEFERHRRWTWRRRDDPTRRHRAFRRLHAWLARLDDRDRGVAIDSLTAWAGLDPAAWLDRRLLAPDDIAARRGDRILDVGAHTITHPPLRRLDIGRQREELAGSKQALEGWLGRPVTTLAYPYGSPGAAAVVREAGFVAACTTGEELVFPDEDPLNLPRLWVGNWSGAEFARRLEALGW